MGHTYTLQLHTGSFVHQMHTFDEIKEKAERIVKKIKISDIILGWNTDKNLNKQLVSYFHEKVFVFYCGYLFYLKQNKCEIQL